MGFLAVAREVLVNLTAGAVGELGGMISYIASLGLAVWLIISWHRKRRAEGKRAVDSWYFISASLLVALLSVGAAAYGLALRSVPIDVISNVVPSRRTIDRPPTPQQRKYFASDIDSRIKAIDRLDSIVARFQPILMQSQEFLNHIRTMITDGTASRLLTNYENDARPLLNELNLAVSEYRIRFPEFEQLVQSEDYSYVVAIPYAASHLRDEIEHWSGQLNFIQTIENTKTFDYWDKSIRSVRPWIEKTRQELARLREQYASAEVYEMSAVPQRTGAAVHVSPNAVNSGMENVKIEGFDNGILDDGKSTRMKNLDIKR